MSRFANAKTGVIVNVDDETAAHLNQDWAPADASPASETPDSTWKVAELKDYAEENGIDLGEATKKEGILAVITATSDSE